MKPGYSKVIIHDFVISEDDPSAFKASMDLNMMSTGGGEERSEARHRDYIEKAGMKISGIWNPKDDYSEGIIECEVAE